MSTVTYKTKTTLGPNLSVESEARGHKIVFDEDKIFGGTNLGMNPIEATLAALGACQCIIARLFAKSRDIDLKDLRMELEGDLHVDDLKKIADGTAKLRIQEIRVKVFIKASAPEEDIRKFADFIENNCPVADILKNPAQLIPEVVIEREE